ncbi:hypothetical protein HYW20_03750 [Candidatus Woesearchaeota archaeon]|nr:hypothetical protein [Candidatus Woesearchaeota archaeon]
MGNIMSPNKFAFALTIIAICLSLLGNFLANFLWGQIESIKDRKLKRITKIVLGSLFMIGFLVLLLLAYSTYSRMV